MIDSIQIETPPHLYHQVLEKLQSYKIPSSQSSLYTRLHPEKTKYIKVYLGPILLMQIFNRSIASFRTRLTTAEAFLAGSPYTDKVRFGCKQSQSRLNKLWRKYGITNNAKVYDPHNGYTVLINYLAKEVHTVAWDDQAIPVNVYLQ